MKYTVLSYFNNQFGRRSPMDVCIYSEGTPVRGLFVAMLQSAYDMDGVSALGGLGSIGSPCELSAKEAMKYVRFGEERSIFDSVLSRTDNRIPIGISADYVLGRAINMFVRQSKEDSLRYDWFTIAFSNNVGSVDELFNRVKQRLE